MKPVKSKIQFINYKVDHMSYVANPQFADSNGQSFEAKPKIDRTISQSDNGNWQVTLKFNVGGATGEFPFDLNVTITGFFKLGMVEEPQKAMEQSGTAILFPYLRSTISMLTTLANVSPLVIPTINLSAMLDSTEKSEKSEN